VITQRMKLPKPEYEHLFYAELMQHNDILMRDAFQHELLISPTAGGFFEGEKLRGTIEGIGAGYTLTRPPGRNDIQFKLLLRTDDGENIFMSSEGTLLLDQSLEKRITEGEYVPPTEYYYRLHLTFDTGSSKYCWLNGKCCLGVAGIKDWSTVCWDVYLVK